MYLSEADVRRLFLQRGGIPRLPADRGCFQPDGCSLGHQAPSLKHTGASIDGVLTTPTRSRPGSRYPPHRGWFFAHDPDLALLSPGYRLAYRWLGPHDVNRAHRLCTTNYELS